MGAMLREKGEDKGPERGPLKKKYTQRQHALAHPPRISKETEKVQKQG